MKLRRLISWIFPLNEKCRLYLLLLIIISLIISCSNNNEHNPSVFFNHLNLVVDSLTYSDICNSEFIKNEFSSFVVRTSTADDNLSWTGAYILGENTYVELFESDEQNKKGISGIGFGVEIIGGIDSLYEHIKSLKSNAIEKKSTIRKVDNRKIPWFKNLYLAYEDTNNIMNTWVMEYDFEYLKFKFPEKNPDSLTISRKCYLSGVYRNDLLLKNIVEIEVSLNEVDSKRLTNELELYGYEIIDEKDKTIAFGLEIKIVIMPKSQDKLGISKIVFSLTKELDKQKIFHFGEKSRLILNNDKTATWNFNI